jgi:hypothetical protein
VRTEMEREGNVRVNIEEHAVSLSVAERYTFRVRFTERLAGGEGVLGAAGLKVVSRGRFDVSDDAAARSGSRRAERLLETLLQEWRSADGLTARAM